MASKENTVLTGQLKRWNEAKGFGFISTENGERDIFIHISDLKGMSRRPVEGDRIHYQIKVQDDGKNRAINASIEGVERIKSSNSKHNSAINNQMLILAVIAVSVIMVGWALI